MRWYCCRDERRRSLIANHESIWGLDYLEVSPNQGKLTIHFIPPEGVAKKNHKGAVPPGIVREEIAITGGERVTVIEVVSATEQGDALEVAVKDNDPLTGGVGDFSRYTFRVKGRPDVDPRFDQIEFSFKVGCRPDIDCRVPQHAVPGPATAQDLGYLAKDYASFRQLMLDRLSLLMPGWKDAGPADLQVALVELLAHAADRLSYYQDAVATEAYLGTARSRVSVRRHARLVDYFMHDGCNARTWIHVRVSQDVVPVSRPALPRGTVLFTRMAGQPAQVLSQNAAQFIGAAGAVFETMHDVRGLYHDHNEMSFYTWGDEECCLAPGATEAELTGHYPNLAAGDVLMLEEVVDPLTGVPGNADPAHRHAVRLTEVVLDTDKLRDDAPITKIRWAAEDALPFGLRMNAEVKDADTGWALRTTSVARGNIVLADHGVTRTEEFKIPDCRLQIGRSVTCAAPVDMAGPASLALGQQPQEAMPVVSCLEARGERREAGDELRWEAQRDLLGSSATSREFVLETESDGTARLRFGDGHYGMRPVPETVLHVQYRFGNGVAGNVGAESIYHIVSVEPAISAVRNPLPAVGGIDPESIEEVRRSAPVAFRTQKRAVTLDDYCRAAELVDGIQQAGATRRWTGSWPTIFLTVDRTGGKALGPEAEAELRNHIEPFRMAGQDLEAEDAGFVPLDVKLRVRIEPGHFQGGVRAALLDALGSRTQPDGRRGLFHPDNFTLGQSVYVSAVCAAAQAVPGVGAVDVVWFRRLGSQSALPKDGRLEMGRLEAARLDNDPSLPEHGVLQLDIRGGE
jgi:hypothetical protein